MASSNSTVDSGVEDETCPICLETLPVETWRGTERTRLLCCGQLICKGCTALLHAHQTSVSTSLRNMADNVQSIAESTTNPTQAIDLSHIQVEYARAISSHKCPMCRTGVPVSDKDCFCLVEGNLHNHPDWAWAQCKLGKYYETGRHCNKDLTRAYTLYETAANQGDIKGQHELGNCYNFGWGVDKSPNDAIIWYRKAADAGFALSQYALGQIYYEQQKFQDAVSLFTLGAIQGLNTAQCSLAYCYEHGEGLEPSLEKSLYWNKKSAEGGNATAMANYGGNLMHITAMKNSGRVDIAGKSVVPEVLFWARKSEAAGYMDAKSMVDQLEASTSNVCSNCEKPSASSTTKFSRCTQCKAVYYCSKDCQVVHWKKGHKWDCVNAAGVKKAKGGN